jgi:hypothetical protein
MPDLLQTVESSTDRLMIENTIIIQVYLYFLYLFPHVNMIQRVFYAKKSKYTFS